jgi:Cu+-exporting ATPase
MVKQPQKALIIKGGISVAKDLVCGMDVDPATAAAKSEYKGETYYFCAPGCKRSFDEDPERFVQAEATGEHH